MPEHPSVRNRIDPRTNVLHKHLSEYHTGVVLSPTTDSASSPISPAAMSPPSPVTDANPVALKVMRLCKPVLRFALPVHFLPCDDVALSQPGVALSAMLTLPQSFGNIYLGEKLSCYTSLCNVAHVDLAHVGLKVEVQTQLQRETLADSSITECSTACFAPQQTLGEIIEYNLKDVGIHILICSALYTDAGGERKYFRKFFKFQVNNPLSMKSKTHPLPGHNEVVVETQLQNTMPRQIFLSSVDFHPASQFEATPMNDFNPALSGKALLASSAIFPAALPAAHAAAASEAAATASSAAGLPLLGNLAYLKAGDTQQYMFRLKGKKKLLLAQLRQVGTLGRMDLAWRTAMGEAGRLQSNTIQRKVAAHASPTPAIAAHAHPRAPTRE